MTFKFQRSVSKLFVLYLEIPCGLNAIILLEEMAMTNRARRITTAT
jgi:hypothetical protein